MVFLFSACGNKTKDANEEQATEEQVTYDFSDKKVGDAIVLGKYEQDNDLSNGKEDIEWIILDKTEDKILVISKYVLDCKKYSDYVESTWENSFVRFWLNTEFIDNVFTYEEIQKILTLPVQARDTKYSRCDPGKTTEDKLFLLDTTETKEYMDSYSARVCKPTPYAIKQGVFTASYADYEGNALWWTRSPGSKNQDYAANIGVDGEVFYYGYEVGSSDIGVRPSMWIEI